MNKALQRVSDGGVSVDFNPLQNHWERQNRIQIAPACGWLQRLAIASEMIRSGGLRICPDGLIRSAKETA
jgi:hypothetical protein